MTLMLMVQMFLKDAAPREGQAFTYGYDMTDPWSHFVEVVSITSEGDLTTKLTDGKRAGVPEACIFLGCSYKDMHCLVKHTV
jgi:hypothetical protein